MSLSKQALHTEHVRFHTVALYALWNPAYRQLSISTIPNAEIFHVLEALDLYIMAI